MANGIYAAAAGMAAQQTRIDAIANDLANADTPGYKSERIGFVDLLYGSENGVAVGSGATTIDAGPEMTEGALGASDNPLSVAIDGPAFFQVQRPGGGVGLTRDGDFQLDSAGNLVTSTGSRLVPPITVPAGTAPKDVTISSNGTVTVVNKVVGKLNLVDVGSPSGLQPVGTSMYVTTAASGHATAAKGTTLVQAQLEQSNVSVPEAMSDLLDAQQNYTILSHAISTQDQLLEIANQLRQ
jgi:flagellar basal-body rod protein FlgG